MKNIVSITTTPLKYDNRIINQCNSLSKVGHDVTVISLGDKNNKINHSKYGFHVKELFLTSDFSPSNLLLNYSRIFEFIIKAMRYCFRKEIDIIHANDLKGLIVAVAIRKINRNCEIVYDAHEYETETSGLKGLNKKLYKYLENKFIYDASKHITVSESIADEYVRLYQIKKPYLIFNYPFVKSNSVEINNIFREKFNISDDRIIFLYQGTINKGRGIELMIKAFSSEDLNDKVLILMGGGNLINEIKKSKLPNNIFIQDFVDPESLLGYTSSADIGLSLTKDTSLNHRFCLPNKLFEYISAGLPVIVSNLPEMKKIVEREKIGIVTDHNLQSLIKVIKSIDKDSLSTYKENVLKIQHKYNWQYQEEKFLNIYY